jgi:molybdate transport system substrate-binding protein
MTGRALAARRAALALLVAAIAARCGGSPQPTPVEITVGVAASLGDAINAAATQYEQTHPNVGVRFSADASSTLRAQIEQGSPIDVFVSADTSNPQQLVDKQLANGPVVPVARNELVIVVPRGSAVATSPADLGRTGVKVIAAGPEVPISKYAAQLVAQLATLPGYPPDYATRVAANTVSREDNVRAVVAKIALGEGDAGIVYVTDTRGADVDTIKIPAGSNVVATYGAVTTTASPHAMDARAFLDWLARPGGRAVLTRFGFLPAPG